MNKIALCINVCADDWTDEMSTIASNREKNYMPQGNNTTICGIPRERCTARPTRQLMLFCPSWH